MTRVAVVAMVVVRHLATLPVTSNGGGTTDPEDLGF
jgi:hypothetical protein